MNVNGDWRSPEPAAALLHVCVRYIDGISSSTTWPAQTERGDEEILISRILGPPLDSLFPCVRYVSIEVQR